MLCFMFFDLCCVMFDVLCSPSLWYHSCKKQYETVQQHLLASAVGGSLKEREKVPLIFCPMKLPNICLIENLAPGKRQVEPSRQWIFVHPGGRGLPGVVMLRID